MKPRIRILLASFALTLVACSDHPYRTEIPPVGAAPAACDDAGAVGTLPSFSTCSEGQGETATRYSLGFVEFDDQGWFHNPQQASNVISQVLDMRARDPKEQTKQDQFLFVIYAHGWKHNAGPNDEDVRDFRNFLRNLDRMERDYAKQPADAKTAGLAVETRNNEPHRARHVVGVYLGWRGATISVPVLKELTFWGRKNSAGRVGRGSVQQFLVEMNYLRAQMNHWPNVDRLATEDESELILLGHSFGGLVMYEALHTEIARRAVQLSLKKDAPPTYKVAKSFGDFVLLVNPAFEGSMYEPLWQAAQTRHCFPDTQRPVMAIVTSKADWATRYAFPFGRLYTFGQAAQQQGERDAVLNTVGHLERYRTHTLDLAPGKTRKEKTGSVRSDPLVDVIQVEMMQNAPTKNSGELPVGDGLFKSFPNDDVFERFPYLNIHASKDIIKDHNDIWNDTFRDIMLDFITLAVTKAVSPSESTDCPAWQNP